MSRDAALLAVTAVVACGGGGGGDGGDAGGPGDGDVPAARCDRPALVDTSSPTTVVGDGTPASCTAAAHQAAATAGGTIVFHCARRR